MGHKLLQKCLNLTKCRGLGLVLTLKETEDSCDTEALVLANP